MKIPSSVTEIGERCFEDCSSLVSADISSSIIGKYCFCGCSSLTSVSISSSVKHICSYCFFRCNNLLEIKCKAITPPSWNGSEFYHECNQKCQIFVPKEAVEIYKNEYMWKEYTILPLKDSDRDDSGEEQCGAPLIRFFEGNLNFTCHTSGAQYHYSVTPADNIVNAYSGDGIVPLSARYDITVYATADGYRPSETVKATLFWLNGNVNATGVNINTEDQRGIVTAVQNGVMTVSGLDEGEPVRFYTLDGKLIGIQKAVGGIVTQDVSSVADVVIARVGNQSVKVMVK